MAQESAQQVRGSFCTVPPEGWSCSRTPGHDGPCAASPDLDEVAASPDLDEVDEVAIAISYQKLIGGTLHDMARASIKALAKARGEA